LSSERAISRLGKPPLRAASIELIIVCSGGEQWSEHFISSQTQFQHRLSSVRAPVCRLLGAGKALLSTFCGARPSDFARMLTIPAR